MFTNISLLFNFFFKFFMPSRVNYQKKNCKNCAIQKNGCYFITSPDEKKKNKEIHNIVSIKVRSMIKHGKEQYVLQC